MNATQLRDVAAGARRFAPAVRWQDQVLSHAEFVGHVDALKHRFATEGLSAGAVIALHLTNVPAFLTSVVAATELGATVMPLDPLLPAGERAALVTALQPSLLLTQATTEVVSNVPHWQVDDVGRVLSHASPRASPRHELLEGTAFIQWSSGSTGRPKGILISPQALWARAQHIQEAVLLDEDERTLVAVPLTHSHGIDCLALPTLLGGGTVWLMPPATATPMSVLRLLSDERLTFFSSVPSFFAICNRLQAPHQYDLSSLKRPFCGSAALSRTVAEGFLERFGRPLQQGYGLAEIGVICLHSHGAPPYLFETVGRPMAPISWKVAPETGELLASSAALCSAYLNDGQLDTAPFADGWLHTQDLVSVDDQGRFFITGRLNQFINVAGQKVNPAEVEQALRRLSWVKECAVVGARDELTGECVAAYLVADRAEGESDDVLKKRALGALRGDLAEFKLPRHWHFREALPKSPLGKVLKPKLTEN